ncbi:RNA polymerase sigma factor FliA [Halioglobus japonicus]|uniref:RNA polymerase sigma factor n=1 Tax=Halioglobus japonicus TaxID=930805 RepID=A0AAP8ME54_9GAMM|nr:RNA polymerase sigma factor FliA [Halioglobus japonicus]AQA20195.1 RNA polymerase sigma factor FliA [Halioglobus japonicus]PLW86120.1 RNA polymerase sigma factor FliA [Halioglobus japonicus]GHD14374.1 RNA polymerase sigma factor FliA [Halioglobus japonicus]
MYTAKGQLEQRDLAEEYIPIVRRHALSLRVRLPASIELDDLVQAGYLGLLEAMQRFDENNGTPFQAYASARIRGAMVDELRSRDWLPRSVRRRAREMEAVVSRLEQSLGHPPSESDIAAAMGIDLEDYLHLLADTNNGLILPLAQLAEQGWEPGDDADEDGTPYLDALYEEQHEHLVAAVEAVPERERLLLALYYQEDLNLKEIGSLMGVSESRVCQLHSQAVARIRSRLGRTMEVN